jgi:TctA family transporter
VLGSRAEDSFRLSMIGSAGDMRVFFSNGLVGSITTLALVLLMWPLISAGIRAARAGAGRAIARSVQPRR